ncbi:MAG: hypothetical protein QM820_09120 [Minicystis sp.]
MTPLPLDSPRWLSLKAHFDNAGVDTDVPAVPSLIAGWNRAVGAYAEEYEYEALRESYLHQRTILDVAYAVVPHLAARLSELDPDRRLSVLDEIFIVEDTRLTPARRVEAAIRQIERTVPAELRDAFIQTTRDRHPPLPDDIAPAYLAAIAHAKAIAGRDWGRARSDEEGPHLFRRHLRYLRTAGWIDADITFGIGALMRERDHVAILYSGWKEARAELRALKEAPPGWFERTKLRGDDEAARLRFGALYGLAYAALEVDLADMLRHGS